ncbi:MAG: hypothetical protein AAB263_13870 [Planctomycetota bacterium]
MKMFEQPATKGDVIAWAIVAPFVMLLPYWFQFIGTLAGFKTMFMSLGTELPGLTRLLLSIGDPWVTMVPIVMVLAMVAVALWVQRTQFKVYALIVMGLSVVLYVQLVVRAIYTPIIELQKQLN